MKHFLNCALKREPCDAVIRNLFLFNVFTGEIEEGEIGIAEGRIVGIGKGYSAKEEFDGKRRIALPAFLDSHIHVESSMLSPEAFALSAVSHGTGGILADPHEIVNVCSVAGAEYIAEAFARIPSHPLEVYLQLPSCVPATPFETSGAAIDGKRTAEELKRGLYLGLGEMMNFPAVLSCEEDALVKLETARKLLKPVDGHAPSLSGDELCAYLDAGILTDHECLTAAECREKVSRGMYVQLRCGSSAENLSELSKAVDGFNFRRFLLCSDDKNARDLQNRGHMDDALRRLVASGVPAKYAILTATLNVAECYSLRDTGALAPRYFADIALVDDLESFRVSDVFHRGKQVVREGKPLFPEQRYLPPSVLKTVKIPKITPERFRLFCRGGTLRAIRIDPHALTTKEVLLKAPVGELNVKGTDLNKLAVVERHFASGNLGLGILQGFGFRGGAMGITVSHDSHNLVVVGDDDAAMARVCELIQRAGGGLAIISSEGEEEVFPLDIAGLMSSKPLEEVVKGTESIFAKAREMGVKECYEPFMSLAFLSLAVIPKLKLTDRGLFDLEKYSFVPLEEI